MMYYSVYFQNKIALTSTDSPRKPVAVSYVVEEVRHACKHNPEKEVYREKIVSGIFVVLKLSYLTVDLAEVCLLCCFFPKRM